MSAIHRRGILLDGIGAELVRSANGGPRKTLAQWLADIADEVAQTFTSGDATPSVLNGAQFITAGSTAITDFDDATEGQVIFVYRGNADITITRDATKIETLTAASVTLTATHPMVSFRSVGGVWQEVERADSAIKATGSTTARTLANRFADTLNVLDRGLVNDGVDGSTGVATATDATFTDASAAWTSADVGKAIAIKGAGTAGAVLVTTIASINSATSIELATPAVTTVASNCLYQYGTDNTTAMNALCAHLVALTTLGARKQVVWPAGIYLYQTSPSWSVHNIRHQGVGDVRLRPIAANANGIIAGGGASGYAWWQGWFDITVEGHGNTSDAVLIESAQHHTYDRINVRGCGAKGFHVKFGVLCHFITPTVSNNQNVGSSGFFWGAAPTHGMYFTRGGPSNESSGHNEITNPILEGVPYGGYEDYCVGNTWHAGALEGCTNTGFLGTANSREVEMFGVDFEANTTMDMDLSCDGGEFYGLHLEDLITIRSGASHNKFFGGDFEVITIASGATYNKFVKCGYNRYGSGAFNDSGTGTEYDLWNITSATRILSDISDTAYDASSWNGVTAVAPSKNAVRDKFETLGTASVVNYTEGTYTPTLAFATPGDAVFTTSGGSKSITGKYIRIGNHVSFEAYSTFSVSYTTASGVFRIGLPFSVSNDDPAAVAGTVSLITNVNVAAGGTLSYVVGANLIKNAAYAQITGYSGAGAVGNIGAAHIASGATEYTICISGTYKAAA